MQQKNNSPTLPNEYHNIPVFTYITFSPSFGQHFILLCNCLLQFHCSRVKLILAMAIYLTKKIIQCYKYDKNYTIKRLNLVKIAFSNFTPSVKLLFISFFIHHKCKSLEQEITRFFRGKIKTKTLKMKTPNTRSLSKMAQKINHDTIMIGQIVLLVLLAIG